MGTGGIGGLLSGLFKKKSVVQVPETPTPEPIKTNDKIIRASFLFDNLRDTTLDLLSSTRPESSMTETIRKCLRNGDSHIYVYLWNIQDGLAYGWATRTTFYKDGFATTLNQKYVQFMQGRLLFFKNSGLKPIGVLLSDDGGYTPFSLPHVRLCAQYFGGFLGEAMLGIETDEYLKPAQEQAMIAEWKKISKVRIGVHHAKINPERAFASGADVYHAQFGWVKNADELVSKANRIRNQLAGRIPYIAAEYDKSSSMRIGQAAVDQAGAIGYGNG